MVTSLTVTSGKTKCAVSRQNANRGRPLGDDSGKIRGSWAIVRRIGDHYVDRVSVIEAERITQPDSGRDLDGSMVPFATVVLVRAKDEGVDVLDATGNDAQTDGVDRRLQSQGLSGDVPWSLEHDVEAAWIQPSTRLLLVDVGMDGHPVGVPANAAGHLSP
jgi:hypothetical protein